MSAIVVSPGFYGIMEQNLDARQTLTREELRLAPQLGEDLYRSVNRLPGVSASDFSAAFRVRGGANRELYATLDGQELLEPFHLKDFDGAFSIIDVGAIAGLDLTTGGFGARYGDRLTGVLAMRTIDPEVGAPARTELALTLTTVRGTSRGSFADGRGAWLLSARRGFLEYAIRMTDEADNLRPRYYDVLGKASYQLGERGSLSIHLLRAGDGLTFLDEADDPRIESGYGSIYVWTVAKASLAHAMTVESVLSAGRLDWRRDGSRISTDLAVKDDRDLRFAGLRQDWSWSVRPDLLLTLGGEIKSQRTLYHYHRRERQFAAVNGLAVASIASVDVSTAPEGSMGAGYLSVRAQPVSRVTVDVGARADRQGHTGERQLSPRVGAAFTPLEGTQLRAAWGRYAQSQGIHELQTRDGETSFRSAELAEQRVVGAEQRIGRTLVARVEAYDRRLLRLQPRRVGVDNGIDVFPEREPDRTLFAPTRGDARGVELLLTRSPGRRVTWTASYALSRAIDVVDGAEVPRTFDQRHAIALDAGWHPAPTWQVSAAWLYHSGWPTTSFEFEVDTLTNGGLLVRRRYEARNSSRLPPYHRLDLRATHDMLSRGTRLSMFLDLFNVYGRRNPRAYDRTVLVDNGRVTFVKSLDALLPRLPSFGVSWEF